MIVMDNRFDGLAEFVAVARLGSFTAAAAELGVTKFAVARAVSRLEARLGVKLLHRTTRRLNLTTNGIVWLKYCRAALSELDHGEEILSNAQLEPSGQVRIDLPSAFGRIHVLPRLINLAGRFPALMFTLSFSDERVDLIRQAVDVAVRIGTLDHSPDLVARPLGMQKMIICAAPDYIAARGTPRSEADLAQHDCIVGWRSGHDAHWLLKQLDGSIAPSVVPVKHEVWDHEALLATVRAGLGLAQLPDWLALEGLQRGHLVEVLDGLSGGELPINILWPRLGSVPPARLRVVIDEIAGLAKGSWRLP